MKNTLDWNHYLSVAARAAAEGIVLLKNEHHALPLAANEEIALFGRIQLHYYKSGTGSGGMVNVTHTTNIPQGLTDAGIRLNERLLSVYREWDSTHPFDPGVGFGNEPWSQEEMPLDAALVQEAAAACRKAIVIIGRTAGEEQDTRMEKGSFLLTDTEEEMLRLVREAFPVMIVLLNTGNIIDMHFMDTYRPDAVAYLWQGGMTGGKGAADVLTGAVSPCGKLPDTIAYEIADYPSHANFGGQNKDVYAEDIYVGYRYFETFARDRVCYPFGFGLSYTTFSVTPGDADGAVLPVTVTNTGTVPGREVVQLYCEAPQGLLGKPARVLTAYEKTGVLAPGASQTLRLPLTPPASYDDSGVTGHPYCFVQEAGVYRFYVGTDVRSAVSAAEITVPELTVVSRHRQALAPVEPFRRMKPVPAAEGYTVGYEDTPLLAYDENVRRQEGMPETLPETDKQSVLADVAAGKVTVEEFVAQLPDEALCELVRGEGMGSPRVTPGTASAFGGVTARLSSYGIPAACCADGPSGIRMDCGTKAFSLPNGTLLASTFDPALLRELYACLGVEMTVNGVDALLGPGMNLHRHPLNGRNFEYFSEDPYLTGTLAAAELQGLHSAGVTGTIKHCCANNQETRRHFLDSVVSERALRELYLRSFEIAVKEGNACSVMTTYGSVNGLWTAGSYDLCTEILRNEWGFDGIIMTDWWADINERGTAPDRGKLSAMVKAQNDLYMVCQDCEKNADDLAEALADGKLRRGELQRCACNICRFLLHTHAMDRQLGKPVPAEILNRPLEETDGGAPMVFYELEDDLTLPLDHVKAERGSSHSFALSVRKAGWYEMTITASSTLSELAQSPVTLFSMGTAVATMTWNGTGGKPVAITKKIGLLSQYTVMRLYFAQGGLKPESIRFRLVSEGLTLDDLRMEG